ncbi:complement C3-like [Amphiprion ocellaris]|uniref:complement C3-like n=1 Tax=Amphiprion ocellaris TaxID=80972 RepID=UPI0024115C05|nr:complement C3-like [Amphiprion ocellaris]
MSLLEESSDEACGERRPYTVAIASYALALDGLPTTLHELLLRGAAPGFSHWLDRENHLFMLEATGYALLALVKWGRMEEAAAPFKWLNSQRRREGGFGSTQVPALKFCQLKDRGPPWWVVVSASSTWSEYLIHKPPPDDHSLDVDVRITGHKEIRYHFNPKTAYAARTSRLPANLDLEVEARGNGQGILEHRERQPRVVTYYNQLHEVEEKMPCKHFDLNVTFEGSSAGL